MDKRTARKSCGKGTTERVTARKTIRRLSEPTGNLEILQSQKTFQRRHSETAAYVRRSTAKKSFQRFSSEKTPVRNPTVNLSPKRTARKSIYSPSSLSCSLSLKVSNSKNSKLFNQKSGAACANICNKGTARKSISSQQGYHYDVESKHSSSVDSHINMFSVPKKSVADLVKELEAKFKKGIARKSFQRNNKINNDCNLALNCSSSVVFNHCNEMEAIESEPMSNESENVGENSV